MQQRPTEKTSLIIGGIATVAVVIAGVWTMLPKMAVGAILVIWGIIAMIRGMRSDSRPVLRMNLVLSASYLIVGAAIFLFSSDWGAGGDCTAVVYCRVLDARTSQPISGAVVFIMSETQEITRGTTNDAGEWIGLITVPYEWRYRLIGSGGTLKLDGLSAAAYSSEASVEVHLDESKGLQIFGATESQGAPAFIVFHLHI